MSQDERPAHGGAQAVAAARRHGVQAMFTLSGGHVFPLYDGAVRADPPMPIVDVRHEQTAVFAAEATARLTRVARFRGAHRRARRHQRRQRGDHCAVQWLAPGRPGRPGSGRPVGFGQFAGTGSPAAPCAGHEASLDCARSRTRRDGDRRGVRAGYLAAPGTGVPGRESRSSVRDGRSGRRLRAASWQHAGAY